MSRRNYDQAVRNGAALLDERGPVGWRHRIDTEALRLADTHACVLGQLYGHYKTGMHELYPWNPIRLGFAKSLFTPRSDWDKLTHAWVNYLEETS